MTKKRSRTPLTKEEKDMGLVATRVLAVEEKRKCDECGKILSRYNRNKRKCFSIN